MNGQAEKEPDKQADKQIEKTNTLVVYRDALQLKRDLGLSS